MNKNPGWDTPFPRHWLRYVVLKLVMLAGAVALAFDLAGGT